MRLIRRVLLLLIVLGAVAWFVLPRPTMGPIPDPNGIELASDLDSYLAQEERRYDDMIGGVSKRILWAEGTGKKTDWAVIYLHGFSATSEEIRPVPDRVAQNLRANLYYARLRGHGRDGDAMAEATADDWGRDVAEALAVGRRIGERVAVISTSTGGTLAAIAATEAPSAEFLDALVMVSPNFKPQNPVAALLTWPLSHLWLSLIAGEERSFEPVNAAQGRYWTERYPTVAAIPMQASVDRLARADLSKANIPALVIYSSADEVVRSDVMRDRMTDWGGEIDYMRIAPGKNIDPYNHVLAGDILSPDESYRVGERISDWLKGL
ncbi:alpha/beta hydrolase [Palleronia caenipelagi]|uniref:Alpha/beta fold hydrolase n=1 Tax=Palleronia caenipelagi TaxID=2489174 RepID=A0A547Q9I9_9RHOB|nr:alpha/beta fold hydrolase [Palleronia caenipelagi]TRD23053.1 alpha/beta fold hydrolase [Palleronia caenipelagi]